MAELVITFVSVIGIVDATINTIKRVIGLLDDYNRQHEELRAFKVELAATGETLKLLYDYLNGRELDPTVERFLNAHTKVIESIIKESEKLLVKDNKITYVLVTKNKLTSSSQKLKDWSILIQGHLQAFQAIESAKNAKTLEDIRKTISDINGKIDLTMTEAINTIPSSIQTLSEKMDKIIEVKNLKDKQTIGDNDLAKIFIKKIELKKYRANQDQWEDIFKRGDAEKDVLVEKIQRGEDVGRRNGLRKLALVLHELGPPQNILSFEGIVEDTARTTLFVSCGTFKDTLHRLTEMEKVFSSLDRIKIAHGVACAFAFLHEAGVYHRNLRSKNIIIDTKTMTPYLSGFAKARRFNDASMAGNANQNHDSLFWEAPERVGEFVAEFGPKCEVYTFGVLLLVIGYWSSFEESSFEEGFLERLEFEKPQNQWSREDYSRMKKSVATESKVFEGTNYGMLVRDSHDKTTISYEKLVEKCIKPKARDRPIFTDISFDLHQILDKLEGDDKLEGES